VLSREQLSLFVFELTDLSQLILINETLYPNAPNCDIIRNDFKRTSWGEVQKFKNPSIPFTFMSKDGYAAAL